MKHVVVAVLAIAACKREAPPARALTSPTLAEAEAFAKDFVTVMVPCNAAKLQGLIDTEILATRVLAGHDLSKAEADGFHAGFRTTVGTQFCGGFGAGNPTYRYLRTQMIEGVPRPLFRVTGDTGFNYHQLELDKDTGKIKIADIYVYAIGEPLSQVLSATVKTLYLDTKSNPEEIKHQAEVVSEATKLLQVGQAKEALALIDQLPPEVRKLKMYKILELQASAGDAERLRRVSTEYETLFPNDPSYEIIMLEPLTAMKRFPEALALIDRLDKRVGGDPYLDGMRAHIYTETGKYPDAIAAAKRAVAGEPTIPDAYWMLVAAQTANKDFAGAIATLETVRETLKLSVDAELLRSDERFVPLVESKEYAAWTKRQ
ncbi:MAG: tetratricopeptide repeat protein [Kofleriaceae bacterium]